MPRYIVFAGVNGAGKTTLYQSNKRLQNIPRVNVDEIVRTNGKWDNLEDVTRAGKAAVAKIRQFFSENLTFNQETTLCGNSIIKNIMTAKEKGYRIELYYVGLESADLAVERVKYRVQNGGHGIPENDIRKRYYKSFEQLKKIITYCDKIELYDNTVSFRAIAVYENGEWILIDDNIPEWCKKIIN